MKKHIAIITNAKEIRSAMKEQIDLIFEDLVENEIYSIEDGSISKLTKADLYLVTSSAYEFLEEKFLRNKNIVITDYTVTKEKLRFLKSFPKGTKIIFFNVSFKMCIEAISMMYHLGVNNIEFIPAYPNMERFPEGNIVMTPAESQLLPKEVLNREIIDIGHRIIDANTIIEIALKLEFEHILYYKKIREYLDSVATSDYSLSKIVEKATQAESQFSLLMKTTNIAILGVDKDNFLCSCNEGAEKILNKRSGTLLGNNAEELLPYIPFKEVKEKREEIRAKLIKIGEEYINLSIIPIIKAEHYMGAFAIFQEFKEEEKKQNELRRQLLNKGHKAKYSFDDIVGENTAMLKLKSLAQKMARIDSDILITGESGTGKELFAHAIHNYSKRKDFPFIVVNCAAIPETLLESELFGYEEGAFTGAKKGGKIGLFEFAHMGTLFLDELEGMSPTLQVKLLRVIQEKEIMRIGGDKVINVDVRIIATTNEELRDLVKQGKFRKDLYYRMSAFPLIVPPLRERKDDLYLLTEKFMRDSGSEFRFSSKAKKAFEAYNWEGNIRELKNYIEFLGFTEEKIIEFEDMPFAIKEYYEELQNRDTLEKKQGKESSYEEIFGERYEEYIFLLKKIEECYLKGESSGRQKLFEICKKEEFVLSEQDIRGILKKLEELEFIEVFKGRRGNRISNKGKEFLENFR
jgi:transcriptional regulator with PAS, ATPase and Fis domain